MLIHNSSFFRIYFGNAQDKIYPRYYAQDEHDTPLLDRVPFAHLKTVLGIKNLIFLKQVHGDQGVIIDEQVVITPFTNEGDFLMTQQRHIGIGVLTADCLPIVFYDRFHKVVAIAHAGWRGSVAGIAVKVVQMMQQYYQTDLAELRIFFGPCAHVCCYRVGTEVITRSQRVSAYASAAIRRHGDTIFFDLPHFNMLQLQAYGVKKEAFWSEYNICTICDSSFFSYRRRKEEAGRQMTVVTLK